MNWGRFNSLFARLFGTFLLAIVVAHILGFVWLQQYGHHRHPPPPPHHAPMEGHDAPEPPPEPPPPPPVLDGPQLLLLLQCVASVIAAWFGARQLTRPILQLSGAAERLSTHLDSPPLIEHGPEELVQAARSFNRMQQRIHEQVRLRSRMLTAVSHDLRTPLTRMRLVLEQLDNVHIRQRLIHDIDEMRVLLESTLSYLEAQSAAEPRQRLDVHALAESLIEDACEHGADATLTGHCQPLQVQPVALRSCLNNLISNALRYAGHVRVSVCEHSDWLEIRVSDNGPGIPAEQREAVFEPFFRLEHSRNRDFGGTGLGLTVAREAVLRQGGTLHLHETPGGGLTAVVKLPR